MDKEYIVTLHRKEDLEQFYNEMQLSNFPLVKKRPLSRNTHYMMTEEQAERLRQDPRVWGVADVSKIEFRRQVNREPYAVTGNFWKDSASLNVSSNDFQWGHIHCAGNQAQRGKTQFGSVNLGATYEQVIDAVEVFNNGRHVDVVICDDPISYDSEEWYSPTSNQTRFVQYQWFNELNSFVSGPDGDDDGQTLPTGTITYGTNVSTPQYHGNHVCGTACGQHYGWAREANIYNIAVTDPWPSGQQLGGLLIFDYLRAFHLSKPINPATGKRNPTITNHSYGSAYNKGSVVTLADISQIVYRNTAYSAANPGPSGWTEAGIEADFGFRFMQYYPAHNAFTAADVQDAIDDGVVIIGAAGNDNLLMDEVDGDDWNNRATVSGLPTLYYNRGAAPNCADSSSINVGALDKRKDFRRASFSNFGPAVDVFAPGVNILSAYGNTGLNDSKYTQGSGNYFYPINGTSMASPQVCGIIACLASGKERFTQSDALGYLRQFSIDGDMTFDLAGGGLEDNTCRQGSPNKYLHAVNPRPIAGHIDEQIGYRSVDGIQYGSSPNIGTSYMTFPRRRSLYAPAPSAQSQTYALVVRNDSSSDWRWTSGTDRSGVTFDDTATYDDWTLNFNVGDTMEITNNAGSIHPFYIKTSPTTGTGDQVTTGTITGNGASLGNTVIWDTTGVNPGTYWYVCSNHSNMRGQIVIS